VGYAIVVATTQTEAAADWDWLYARLVLLAEVAAGSMFVVFGIRARLGTAGDVRGNTVASFFSAFLGAGVAYLNQLGVQAMAFGVGCFWAVCLLVAAILATSGRNEYLLWRKRRVASIVKNSYTALAWFLAICAGVAVIAAIGNAMKPFIAGHPKPPKVDKFIF
jgi:hypothetical protein